MNLPTAIFKCCREYIGVLGVVAHRCVYCGTRPRYDRPDCCDQSWQCPTTGKVDCAEHGGPDLCCFNPECPSWMEVERP